MAVRTTNTVPEALDSVMQTLASALLYPDAGPYVDFITDLMARIQDRIQRGMAGGSGESSLPPNQLPSSQAPELLPQDLVAQPMQPNIPVPGVMGRPDVSRLIGNPDEVRRMIASGGR